MCNFRVYGAKIIMVQLLPFNKDPLAMIYMCVCPNAMLSKLIHHMYIWYSHGHLFPCSLTTIV